MAARLPRYGRMPFGRILRRRSFPLEKNLPDSWQPHNFGCINNKAFAFCRVDHATDPNRKGYWWFGLVDGKVVPLPVNRL